MILTLIIMYYNSASIGERDRFYGVSLNAFYKCNYMPNLLVTAPFRGVPEGPFRVRPIQLPHETC